MIAVLARAALPTSRAIRWTPIAGASALLLVAAMLTAASGRPADLLPAVAAAALASLLVGSLHDPAHDLMAPVPVSAMQRRALRLALVGVAVLLVWTALGLLAQTSPAATGVGALLALATSGVAVAVWGPARTGVLLGAVVPVLWFAVDQAVPGGGLAADLVGLWRTDPWPVVAVALVVCVMGRHR